MMRDVTVTVTVTPATTACQRANPAPARGDAIRQKLQHPRLLQSGSQAAENE
ncbi:MAG: hypothetical protein OD918_01625 [Gammaproteobacteria bacterium]